MLRPSSFLFSLFCRCFLLASPPRSRPDPLFFGFSHLCKISGGSSLETIGLCLCGSQCHRRCWAPTSFSTQMSKNKNKKQSHRHCRAPTKDSTQMSSRCRMGGHWPLASATKDSLDIEGILTFFCSPESEKRLLPSNDRMVNFGGLDAPNREQQGIPQPSFSLLLHACASLTKCIPVFVSENTLVDPISAEPGECLRIPDLLDYEIPTKDDSCPHHQPSGDLFLPILCSVMITGGGSTLTLGSPVRDAAAKGCGV